MKSRVQHSGTRLRAVSMALALAIVLLSALAAAPSAQAQTYTVVYNFTGSPDGDVPSAGLIGDASGNLYSTTWMGGNNRCEDGCGTIFKLDDTGKETVLYAFHGDAHGASPAAGLIWDAAGNLYGTTSGEWAEKPGTVFKLDNTGKETLLYAFTGGKDGSMPFAGLVRDAQGNLYGTTAYGGASGCWANLGCGVVFKLDKTGKETVLHTFSGGNDGGNPMATLVQDASGNLYGTTEIGGDLKCHILYGTHGCGPVFKLDKKGKETVLHKFGGKNDGKYPEAGLLPDSQGNFYGTTYYGGAYTGGTVFKLDATGKETVLYSFGQGGDGDGANPEAGLIMDAAGNLYGTTYKGGSDCSVMPCGTVFELDTTGKETVLHVFEGSDGSWPEAGLLQDASGNLYGTTAEGGEGGSGCYSDKYGCGVVFKITLDRRKR